MQPYYGDPFDAALRHPVEPSSLQILSESEAMRLAVAIAWRGAGTAQPNPLVGSVVLDRDGRFLGAGHHDVCGEAHAEVNALADVARRGLSDRLAGAVMYVTLEPCAHIGRTPACAQTLAKLPMRGVRYGARDPFPKVDGQGAQILNAAGIDCQYLAGFEGECQQLIERFRAGVVQGRCFVGMKVAATLDGRIANRGDSRRWLTGDRARQYGHFLRWVYDAVAVGADTVICDNPSLLPRLTFKQAKVPWRVVFDPSGRAAGSRPLVDMELCRTQPERVIWLIEDSKCDGALAERLRKSGVQVVNVKASDRGFSASEVLEHLFSRNVHSLLLEGGAGLYGYFLQQNLVERLHYFQAPMLGGEGEPVYWHAHWRPSWPLDLSAARVCQLDQDLLLEASLQKAKG